MTVVSVMRALVCAHDKTLADFTFLRYVVLGSIMLARVHRIIQNGGSPQLHPKLTGHMKDFEKSKSLYVIALFFGGCIFVQTEGVGLTVYFATSAFCDNMAIFGFKTIDYCATTKAVALYSMALISFLPTCAVAYCCQHHMYDEGSWLHDTEKPTKSFKKPTFLLFMVLVTIVSFVARIYVVYQGYIDVIDDFIGGGFFSFVMAVVVPPCIDAVQATLLVSSGIKAKPETPTDATKELLIEKGEKASGEEVAATGAPLMLPAPWIPPMASWFYTQSSLQAMQQWRSDPTRYWAPDIGIFAAFPHLWTRESFWCFHGLVIASIICVVYSPTYHRIVTWVFGILALIVVIPCSLRSLRHLILPWKASVMEVDEIVFGLPFVPFDIGAIPWLCVGTMLSLANLWAKMTGWVAIALATSNPEDVVSLSAQILLALGIIMPVKEVIFSQPAPTKCHDETFNIVKFEEPNANNVENGEAYFCTYAEHLGLKSWCATHDECYLKYGSSLGNWFASKQAVEIPLVNIDAIYRLVDAIHRHRGCFNRHGQYTLTQKLYLKVLRNLQLILRHRVQSTIPTTLLSTLPMLLTQVVTFHVPVEPRLDKWLLVSGMFAGFLSFVVTTIGGYPTHVKIFKEFLRIRREWESSPCYSPEDPERRREEEEEELRKDIQDELASATIFFVVGFVLELVCGCAFVLLASQVLDDLRVQLPKYSQT